MKVTEIFTLGYGDRDNDRHDHHWRHDNHHRHHHRRWWDRRNNCWHWD